MQRKIGENAKQTDIRRLAGAKNKQVQTWERVKEEERTEMLHSELQRHVQHLDRRGGKTKGDRGSEVTPMVQNLRLRGGIRRVSRFVFIVECTR